MVHPRLTGNRCDATPAADRCHQRWGLRGRSAALNVRCFPIRRPDVRQPITSGPLRQSGAREDARRRGQADAPTFSGKETDMSRTEIRLAGDGLLVVGWDPPLATFY